MQKVFYGKEQYQRYMSDLNVREMVVMTSMSVVIIFLGLFPSSVFDISASTVDQVIQRVEISGGEQDEIGKKTGEEETAIGKEQSQEEKNPLQSIVVIR